MKLSNTMYLFSVLIFSSCMNNNKYFDNTYNSEYRGVIQNIYKDVSNHNCTVFDLQIEKGVLSNIVADAFPGSVEFASIGDSILKNYGNVNIVIKKKNGVEKNFKLDW
jgi:hypothetical protein